MDNNKYRHEYKAMLNSFDYITLKMRLKHIAKLDKNAGDDGSYKVTSLYFDNVYDKALAEKVNGNSVRQKFRIRYYGDDLSFIKLEKKSKHNNLCLKETANLTKEQCEGILTGDCAWMSESAEPLFAEFYALVKSEQLRPKIIVQYKREAYIYRAGNTRVTFDSEIKASTNTAGFLTAGRTMASTGNNIILEIKYDEFIPDVMCDIVQTDERKTSAFSKYQGARGYFDY